jgi:hypothetical protein
MPHELHGQKSIMQAGAAAATAFPVEDALRPIARIGMKKVLPGPLTDTMLLVPHPIF